MKNRHYEWWQVEKIDRTIWNILKVITLISLIYKMTEGTTIGIICYGINVFNIVIVMGLGLIKNEMRDSIRKECEVDMYM